jgi:hypothetical protein
VDYERRLCYFALVIWEAQEFMSLKQFYSHDGSGNEGSAGELDELMKDVFSPIGQGLIDGIANGFVERKTVIVCLLVKEPVSSPAPEK